MNNYKLKPWSIISISTILILFTTSTYAAEMGVYGGIGAGYAVLEEVSPNTDQADIGSKLYAGMRIFGPLGIEAGIYNLGTYNNEQDKITGTTVSAVASLDTKSVSLFAKAGIIDWEVKDITPGGRAISGTNTAFGIGINVPVEKQLLFRVEWERFNKIGEDAANSQPGQNLSLLTVGVNFMF